jgi:1-pyrroline-5-carboxylate dehydrogenase
MQNLPDFRNEPFTDFGDKTQADAMRAAIERVKQQLGQTYALKLGAKYLDVGAMLVSTSPAHPDVVIGRHAEADASVVARAVAAAEAAFPGWSARPVEERAGLLLCAAKSMRGRKFEFCAWLVWEAGKNWAEADADTAEAIDFMEFYAREALRLAGTKLPIQLPGERNELAYVALGVGAVIPPWNFPLAIMAGMTTAAIVTGNTVVLKPSPLAPTIAARFLLLLQECGLPAGVVTLCQGGAELGSALIQDPGIHFIAFTGSKRAGLDIHAKAAHVGQGQRWIKRTILELGGKDAIIVEADADLDAAADGVIASAFGFNGQKCSACSRVIVNEAVLGDFQLRLVERIGRLAVGDPAENYAAGPVISEQAYERILGMIGDAAQRGRVLAGGAAETPAAEGYYIQPTLIAGLAPSDRICQEEIFGPVLAVLASKDFEDALAIANDTEYGLTGAVYTASEEKLARAAAAFHVGNLYFNRKCTGAMVGAHPFGGFKMSGTDSKAGGPDYLLLFTQAKSISYKL